MVKITLLYTSYLYYGVIPSENVSFTKVIHKKSRWMKTKVCGKDADAINQVAVTFKIRNGNLSEVELYKYLGLHIDNNLSGTS